MKRFILLSMCLACGSPAKAPPVAVVAPPVAEEAPAPSLIPATPAGRTLSAWLDVFSGADAPGLPEFVARYKHPEPADALVQFRAQTGGFELVSVEKSEPLALTFVVKEKAGPTQAVGWLKVKDGDPAEIVSFKLAAIPPGATAADMNPTLDAAARTRVLDGVVARLHENYVFPEVAKKMEEAVRAHQARGAYDQVVEARELAGLLTEQLREVSRDLHLRVGYSPAIVKEQDADAEPTAEEKAQMREELERINCGFEKAERLDGNLGYVKFNMFGDAEICGPVATQALGSLGAVDALIFDLRGNGGGEPAMVAFVSSYLFAKRTHLNDIYERKANKTTQYWTKPEVPGTKFVTQPVYVLTSRRTFSGAEEFSYNLKNLKRATIVGETTGGGAHPTMPVRVDDHFFVGVPFARAINPITKTNWEGTGVEPDVAVPAADALETAKQLAVEALKKKPRKK